jgi:hypothetical protein
MVPVVSGYDKKVCSNHGRQIMEIKAVFEPLMVLSYAKEDSVPTFLLLGQQKCSPSGIEGSCFQSIIFTKAL